MNKNQLSQSTVRIGVIHITDTDFLNNLLEPMNVGVTSDEAFYGANKFALEVANADAVGLNKIQRVSIAGDRYTVVYERTFNGTTFSTWLPRIGTSRPTYAPVGYSYFDVNFAKWYTLLSNVKTYAVVDILFDTDPTSDGNVTLTIGSMEALIPIVEGDWDANAETVLSVAFLPYIATALEGGFRLTSNQFGVAETPAFADTDETGLTVTIDVVEAGSDNVWVDALGSGNVGDLPIIGLAGEMSFIEIPSAPSVLRHTGSANTLPTWAPDRLPVSEEGTVVDFTPLTGDGPIDLLIPANCAIEGIWIESAEEITGIEAIHLTSADVVLETIITGKAVAADTKKLFTPVADQTIESAGSKLRFTGTKTVPASPFTIVVYVKTMSVS